MNTTVQGPEAETSAAPLTLWLTDRSRFKTGLSRCPRERYLKYHFGPSGYGITTLAQALPLATGQYVAQAFELLLKATQATDTLPEAPQVRQIVAEVQGRYEALLVERGFRGVLAGAATDETIQEQKTLIAGLAWTIRLEFLPWFIQRYRVVDVERERLHFLSCTCGALATDEQEHIRRGCQGVALMQRLDLLAANRDTGSFAYFEVKTTGWDSDAWVEQWETDYQLALGTLDAVARYGQEVTELYIVGLRKGRRVRPKAEDGQIEPGPKRQESALCYGYCRPSNPPLTTDDWLPAYKYVDAEGKPRSASRQHRKRPVHELAKSDWPVIEMMREREPDATVEELWFRLLPPDSTQKVCFVLGPMNRQDAQLASVRTAMLAEERRWQDNLWAVYNAQTLSRLPFHDDDFQTVLDQAFPQAWSCRPFGTEHQCEFVPICHRYSGWQDPLTMGKYTLRLPHHQPEIDQAVARGLLAAQAQPVEEQE